MGIHLALSMVLTHPSWLPLDSLYQLGLELVGKEGATLPPWDN